MASLPDDGTDEHLCEIECLSNIYKYLHICSLEAETAKARVARAINQVGWDGSKRIDRTLELRIMVDSLEITLIKLKST
jgi:hypothetical protein